MAEREGFEPPDSLRSQWFSKPPRSAAPASLRSGLALTSYSFAAGTSTQECPRMCRQLLESQSPPNRLPHASRSGVGTAVRTAAALGMPPLLTKKLCQQCAALLCLQPAADVRNVIVR